MPPKNCQKTRQYLCMETARQVEYNGSCRITRPKQAERIGGRPMELTSIHTLALTEEDQPLWLTYKLLATGGRYGVLCYLEGVDPDTHPCAAARAEGLFPCREEGEALLRRLAVCQVTPAHLKDLLWELVG